MQKAGRLDVDLVNVRLDFDLVNVDTLHGL